MKVRYENKFKYSVLYARDYSLHNWIQSQHQSNPVSDVQKDKTIGGLS